MSEKQKTFEQIINDKKRVLQTSFIGTDVIIECAKEWLQQQLTGSELLGGRCWDLTIKKLLEELEQEKQT